MFRMLSVIVHVCVCAVTHFASIGNVGKPTFTLHTLASPDTYIPLHARIVP